MQNQCAHNAISAAAVTLCISVGSTACFLPPLNTHVLHSALLMTALGMAIGISTILHFIFVGIAATRLERNTALWVIISMIFFPIGSIIGLILFEWFTEEKQRIPTTAA